jgi:predicted nucleotidyltransferase
VCVRRERLAGEELERVLTAVTGALVRDLSPERIVLFGSFARSDQNRTSDLDLVVIAATTLPFCERIGRALESAVSASTRLPVEPLVYTPEEWERMVGEGSSFAALVLREGRVLYERRPESRRSAPLARAGAA